MEFRNDLLSAESCTFTAVVTADYGDSLNEFTMDCQGDKQGRITFEITAPESISGIQGTIADDGGNVLFEEDALYFPLLTDDQLIPASAPWIFLRSLRAGCITAVCREEERLHITVDDSFEDDALTLDVWLEEERIPIHGDILYDGKRILSLDIKNFVVL
ncbi:MAG: hypothetical protein ACI3V0_08620 [Faecousia sp.]